MKSPHWRISPVLSNARARVSSPTWPGGGGDTQTSRLFALVRELATNRIYRRYPRAESARIVSSRRYCDRELRSASISLAFVFREFITRVRLLAARILRRARPAFINRRCINTQSKGVAVLRLSEHARDIRDIRQTGANVPMTRTRIPRAYHAKSDQGAPSQSALADSVCADLFRNQFTPPLPTEILIALLKNRVTLIREVTRRL